MNDVDLVDAYQKSSLCQETTKKLSRILEEKGSKQQANGVTSASYATNIFWQVKICMVCTKNTVTLLLNLASWQGINLLFSHQFHVLLDS